MSREISIPESPKDEAGRVLDSNFRFKYYRKHFWDNVDLNDDALVNNPVFHNKLEFYFGKNMCIQHWDSVLYYAFDFCDRLKQDSKMFEYSVGWIASTFGKSDIMGMDKVYLYMLDRYYCTKNAAGKSPAFWVAEDKFEDMCDNLKNKLNLVIGARPPNLILRDTTDTKWFDFYSLKSDYTIVYFWDPECGHCKKKKPKLETHYKKKFKSRNIEIFAIGKAIGKDFEGWKQEQGLYYPNEFDKAFTPILSSNDKGETPKNGALLVAPYGKGYYIYTGLSFFRELPEGVSGAYKLLANIISLKNTEVVPSQNVKP
jgi:thiol-disulfide isomerase/thioredoxin